MERNPRCGVFTNMGFFLLVSSIFLFHSFPTMARQLYSTIESEGDYNQLQTYIVHVKQPETTVFATSIDREAWYRSFLPASIASLDEPRMVYTYNNVISGFSARLTAKEVEAMKAMEGFVAARPDRLLRLQTTHSPRFLGLSPEMGFWRDSNFGKGVIVGVLDTGVSPSHPSFSGEGMPPPPSKWKGRCEFNASSCNNKLIGARSFDLGATAIKGSSSPAAVTPPIDEDGHGTHTASTATGRFVENASLLGNANGTAVGMAPLAHLAIYKVCFGEDCADSDILAGLDAAVEDGVDVLSLSIGEFSTNLFEDTIAIASFGAMQKGIFISCAAANSGPFNSTLSNEAPWILTVGASTTDRSIRATVRLGDGEEFDGESVFQPKDFKPTLLPLVYLNGKPETATCTAGSLNGTDLRGKIVLCDRGGATGRLDKGSVVKSAGGAAMILLNRNEDGFSTIADPHVLPASHVSFTAGLKIKSYLNSTTSPTATIVFKGTFLGTKPSPMIASFSSRGPSISSPGILKPDIIGPGVSILAAWPFPIGPSSGGPNFNIISGTSMSTPHLSGIAALIKSAHPNWSPAAIKSAMMTTADWKGVVDETLHPANLFAMGAGHVNPSMASHPGLVYDLGPEDYISYLCGLGYNDTQLDTITRSSTKCSSYKKSAPGELNYPSFSLSLGPSQTFTRTVTNVGEAHSSYKVQIFNPQGVKVSVSPDTLYFKQVNQKLTYSVTFSRSGPGAGSSPFSEGSLIWVSSKYSVRSPISVTFL